MYIVYVGLGLKPRIFSRFGTGPGNPRTFLSVLSIYDHTHMCYYPSNLADSYILLFAHLNMCSYNLRHLIATDYCWIGLKQITQLHLYKGAIAGFFYNIIMKSGEWE